MMGWLRSERRRWAARLGHNHGTHYPASPGFDAGSRDLWENALPRGVLSPRFEKDRERVNYWMSASQLMLHQYVPGQIIIGKFANQFLGHLDDRPMVTIAGARAGGLGAHSKMRLCSSAQPPSVCVRSHGDSEGHLYLLLWHAS
jgi:type IV secretion system protein VirD4